MRQKYRSCEHIVAILDGNKSEEQRIERDIASNCSESEQLISLRQSYQWLRIEYDKQAKQHQSNLQRVESVHDVTRTALKEKLDEIQVLDNTNKKISSKLTKLKSHYVKLNNQFEKQTKKKETIENENKQLQGTIDKLNKNIEKLEKKINKLKKDKKKHKNGENNEKTSNNTAKENNNTNIAPPRFLNDEIANLELTSMDESTIFDSDDNENDTNANIVQNGPNSDGNGFDNFLESDFDSQEFEFNSQGSDTNMNDNNNTIDEKDNFDEPKMEPLPHSKQTNKNSNSNNNNNDSNEIEPNRMKSKNKNTNNNNKGNDNFGSVGMQAFARFSQFRGTNYQNPFSMQKYGKKSVEYLFFLFILALFLRFAKVLFVL